MMDPGADHEQDLKWGQEVWSWKWGYFLDQDFDEEDGSWGRLWTRSIIWGHEVWKWRGGCFFGLGHRTVI